MSLSTKANPAATKFSYPSTEAALYFIEDVMERALVPFVLLGDVCRSVYRNLDTEVTQPIEIGIKKTHMTQYARKTLPMFLPADTVYADDSINFTWDGTPVQIKIIMKDWKVLDKPDQVFYRITHFNIPNPFQTYWKQRNLIR